VDNNFLLASVTATVLNQDEQGNTVYLRDKIIWNSVMDGVRTFINIIDNNYPKKEMYCLVDDFYTETSLDWIFGIDPGCAEGNNTDCRSPTVAGMLHAAGCWNMTGKAQVRGVDVIQYQTFQHSDDPATDISLTYYWTDVDKWTSSGGQGESVPIRAEMHGLTMNDKGEEVPIDVEIDYQSFFVEEPAQSEFYPIQDMFCQGRGMTRDIPHNFPEAYKFGSELVLVRQHDGYTHKLISARNEWYDYTFNLSRVDYKPLPYNVSQDPIAVEEDIVTEIMDFIVGLKFRINQAYGNCSIEKLDVDPANPEDVVIDENGHVTMMSPVQFFHLDQKYAANGQFYDRGIKMDAFATTFMTDKDDPEKNKTVIVYIGNSQYLNVDQGKGEYMLPMKVIQYPSDSYNSKWDWTTYNIHHFTKTEDGFQDFDISPCFSDHEKLWLSITFPLISEIDFENSQRDFIKSTNLILSQHGKVAPIRIQQVQSQVMPDAGTFDLIFLVVGPPPFEPGAVDLPIEYMTPLDDVQSSLQATVDNGNLVLYFFNIDVFHNTTAVKNSLRVLDPSKFAPPPGTSVSYTAGYTSGAMAGLAFGMIFLGMLVAAGIYVVFLRNNVRAGLPVMRGIDNPMAGLKNLVGNENS